MANVLTHSLFTDYDIYLFRQGKHFKLYEKFGAHPIKLKNIEGCYFAVYAPNASSVSVIGDFNEWNGHGHFLFARQDGSGVWEGFIPKIGIGYLYKYRIVSSTDGQIFNKADPYGFLHETPPKTSSVVWDLAHQWKDKKWMDNRQRHMSHNSPFIVYEVHLGSWMKDESGQPVSYAMLSDKLVKYVKHMGFTHVEFLPVMEHPYEPSWGYQVTGFFAPTSRFGNPQDFMNLVESLHAANVGVILDWVPAHFPSDGHALSYFDGSHLYEHPDSRKGFHPDWKSLIFNFEKNEIRSFLISSAMFWLQYYHIDGLRVDAVASMIYLDYSRKEGEWEKNEYGGNEYLAAISLLKDFNSAVFEQYPSIQTIAEESTAFAGVTLPVHAGGLGFGMKWMMGWMHDTLNYFSKPPIYRKFHQDSITFSIVYAFSENFMLPFSHDEVVHGKAPLLHKMPGDEWQKFANLRAIYGYMYTHPGAKLIFMGCEFAQTNEWNFADQLQWYLLQYPSHQGMLDLVRDLNHLYKSEEALYLYQFEQKGFEWLDFSNHEHSVICFIRKNDNIDDCVITICNFNITPHEKYRIGVPQKGDWEVILNTDNTKYWGSGYTKEQFYSSEKKSCNGRVFSIEVSLPPMAVMILKKK